MKKKFLILSVFSLFTPSETNYFAGNRYFPWLSTPVDCGLEPYSGVRPTLFFITADEAYAHGPKHKQGIPEIFGVYDQKAMSDDLIALGLPTPLLPQWQIMKSIPWYVSQKLEGQGIRIGGEHAVYKGLSLGYVFGFMHLFSDQSFNLLPITIKEMGLQPAQIGLLDQERREMFAELGLDSSQWAKSGLLDTVLYARYGRAWEYEAKCRQVSLSVMGAIVLPSGELRDPNNTASVPFDGDGRFGFFLGTDDAFELKEDLTVGVQIALGHRSKKTVTERMTLNEKNFLFGALEGDVSIDPGVTFAIRPYGIVGNLRDGFDIYLQYSYANHSGDLWQDARINPVVPSNLNGMYDKTAWVAEYVSLTVLYDSGRVVKNDEIRPSLLFSWDIPVHIFGSEESSKTNRISVGVEVCF